MELLEKGISLISFSLIGAIIESLIPRKLTVLIMGFLMLVIEFDLSFLEICLLRFSSGCFPI